MNQKNKSHDAKGMNSKFIKLNENVMCLCIIKTFIPHVGFFMHDTKTYSHLLCTEIVNLDCFVCYECKVYDFKRK